MRFSIVLASSAAAASALSDGSSVPDGPLVPLVYPDIPLGSIKPNGWLLAEMQTEAAGLAGSLYNFWSFVHKSSWLGGTEEYSMLNEAFPYWLNGLVPLAYTLDDSGLKEQVHTAVDYVLEHDVAEDGWIGPETGGYRLLWARTLMFLAFTNLADANQTYEQPIVTAMHNFNALMNSMLKNNGTGLVEQEDSVLDQGYYFWFLSRTHEMIVSLQWLYDKHPQGQEQVLLENMQMLHDYGYKWEGWFTNQSYAFQDLYDLSVNVTNTQMQFLHGVNLGEGTLLQTLVLPVIAYIDRLIETAQNGVNWTFAYHGAASGTVLADEREAGLSPWYGSETCTAVEVMFSLGYNFRALGNSYYADWAELAAFNALPGAVTGDWWAHVYMSEPNQPYSKNLSASPFWNVNTVGQTFGLEPNYPCCTANHPQGLPKYALYSYNRVGESGILHALLGPTTVATSVSGRSVTIECQTNYPFEDVLIYNVDAEVDFDLYVRIPTWAAGSSLTSATAASSCDAASGLHKISLAAGHTQVTYTIDTDIRTVSRANDTIAVYRGQLLYALHIGADVSSTGPHNYSSQELFPPNYAPPKARDYTMLNTTEWNVAIDPDTLTYHPGDGRDPKSTLVANLPTPIFAAGAPPMYMTAKGCLIDWPMNADFNNSVPGAPLPKAERVCLGDAYEVKLVPYGSAKLRMTELPTISLP